MLEFNQSQFSRLVASAVKKSLSEVVGKIYDEEIFTQSEAAKFMKMSPRKFSDLVKSGKIKRYTVDKSIRYKRSELIASLQLSEVSKMNNY